MDYKTDKSYRLLRMNEQLACGGVLRKESLASAFDVTPKTVQRDLESLRIYLLENGEGDLRYDRKHDCYQLERTSGGQLTEKEVFAVSKVLIESRAFNKEEFDGIELKMSEILSELEMEVLSYYLQGKSYQEIADDLSKHVKSIDNALQRVKRKLEKYIEEVKNENN